MDSIVRRGVWEDTGTTCTRLGLYVVRSEIRTHMPGQPDCEELVTRCRPIYIVLHTVLGARRGCVVTYFQNAYNHDHGRTGIAMLNPGAWRSCLVPVAVYTRHESGGMALVPGTVGRVHTTRIRGMSLVPGTGGRVHTTRIRGHGARAWYRWPCTHDTNSGAWRSCLVQVAVYTRHESGGMALVPGTGGRVHTTRIRGHGARAWYRWPCTHDTNPGAWRSCLVQVAVYTRHESGGMALVPGTGGRVHTTRIRGHGARAWYRWPCTHDTNSGAWRSCLVQVAVYTRHESGGMALVPGTGGRVK